MKTLAFVCALCLPLTLAGCSSSEDGTGTAPTGPTPPAAPTASEVTVFDFQFSPSNVQIPKGGKVTWKNTGGSTHTATSDGGVWDSGSMAASTAGGGNYDQTGSVGGSFTRTFNETGTYEYHCSFHPNMTGRIVVSD